MAVVVAVLGVAAVAAEEPHVQSAPGATASAGDAGTAHGEWCRPDPFTAFVLPLWKETLLGLAMLGVFVAGLRQRRHDWKPLVLGFFALGMGLVDMTWLLIDGFSYLASKGIDGVVLADICELCAKSLVALHVGLIVVLVGGLFTVILRWRNERFRAAEEAAVEEGDVPEDAGK